MSWFNDAQRVGLLKKFWSGDVTQCPTDGSPLMVFYRTDGQNYLLSISCPRCDRKAQFTRYSDPARSYFRAWTENEVVGLKHMCDSSGTGDCPVCRANVVRRPSAAEDQVLECPRCGNLRLIADPCLAG